MSAHGSFSGEPLTRWITDPGDPDREMRVEEDFWFDDPDGQRWDAPKGSVVNGASIPRVLWSAVGSPFDGDYRNASIVHDVACDERRRPWRDVHRMFYFACRAGGTSRARAKVMYGAVAAFGPRWRLPGPDALPLDEATEVDRPEERTPMEEQEAFVARLSREVEMRGGDISLDEIDARVEERAGPAGE